MERIIKRGDIYYAELNPIIGSEQGGTRPVLIISNDIGNKHSPTVIIAAITSRVHTKAKLPTHTAVSNYKARRFSKCIGSITTDHRLFGKRTL